MSVKSKGKLALINDGILHVVCKIDRSAVITALQFCNDCVLDLIQTGSGYLADDIDYDFWYAALGDLFKETVK
jgi:hypothetical protein